MDLEAQGHNKLNLCEKCFALADYGAEFCPECGASLTTEPGAEGSDAAIYPDLARANLLRMRGDYKQAQDVCLALLRRFPNNATANTLLGDIAAEEGDLEHAAEWYELALDLNPDSPAEQHKLQAVRQRLTERDAASSVKQLELPQSNPRTPTFILGVVGIILVAGIIAFAFGRQTGKAQGLTEAGRPYNLPARRDEQPIKQDPPRDVADSTQPTEPEPAPVIASRTAEDIALTQAIAAKSTDGTMLLDASEDPRTHGIRLTFSAASDEPRLVAARLAAAAFSNSSQSQRLFIRGVRDGKLFYCASASREVWEPTQESSWQEAHKDDAKFLADAILADEWTAP